MTQLTVRDEGLVNTAGQGHEREEPGVDREDAVRVTVHGKAWDA